MIVKVYGTRGLVPVSGKDKSIYRGNTICYKVNSNRMPLIIDVGSVDSGINAYI